MTKKCDISSCTKEAICAGLCKACYSGLYYWQRKGVKAVMTRRHQLRVLEDRLDNLRPANVIHLRARRRA